jgi:hypothetical protein
MWATNAFSTEAILLMFSPDSVLYVWVLSLFYCINMLSIPVCFLLNRYFGQNVGGKLSPWQIWLLVLLLKSSTEGRPYASILIRCNRRVQLFSRNISLRRSLICLRCVFCCFATIIGFVIHMGYTIVEEHIFHGNRLCSPTFAWNRRHGTNLILKSSSKPFLWIYSQLLVVPTWSTGGSRRENRWWRDLLGWFLQCIIHWRANITCISSIPFVYNQTTEVENTVHALLYLVKYRCTILLCPIIISLL